jgi:cytochrome c peroxidase
MDALTRAENPSLDSPATIDCAACHLANRLRGHLQTAFGLSSPLAYTSPAEATRLIGGAERDNDNLRAFGYFDAQPAISQRVANETVQVLAAMR